MILSCHFTITSNKEAPTEAKELQIEGALGTLGASEWITISPDYSGFGVTASSPQAYLQADITARQCLDAYKSAKELLQAKGYNYGPHQALLGYSQGGHVAMSVQRYLSTTNQEQLFEKIFAGGGPYDIEEILKSYLEPDAKTYYPCAIGLVFVGVNDSKKLGLDYSKVFREPFDKKMAAWISCKELTTDDINDSVFVLLDSDVKKGVLVSDIINTSYVNPGNVELSAFFDNVRSNTLLSNWKPQSNGDYFLYHSSEDQVVPYFCFEHMIDYLTSNGVDSKRLKTFTATGAHTNAALMFIMKSLEELGEVE